MWESDLATTMTVNRVDRHDRRVGEGDGREVFNRRYDHAGAARGYQQSGAVDAAVYAGRLGTIHK